MFMFTKRILLIKSTFNKTPSFDKKDGLSNGEFLKNTEVLKKHGILMKTPSFGKKDGLFENPGF